MSNWDINGHIQVTNKLMCPECKRLFTREQIAAGHDCEV